MTKEQGRSMRHPKWWLAAGLGAGLGALAGLGNVGEAAGQGMPQFAPEMVAGPDGGAKAAIPDFIKDVRTPRAPPDAERRPHMFREAATWLLGIDIFERTTPPAVPQPVTAALDAGPLPATPAQDADGGPHVP